MNMCCAPALCFLGETDVLTNDANGVVCWMGRGASVVSYPAKGVYSASDLWCHASVAQTGERASVMKIGNEVSVMRHTASILR